jgi:hypothetical protein
MLWGTFRHGATEYRVHVHVVPAGSPEVAALRGFRDALRADPVLRRRYTVLKRAIVAGGPADPVAFTKAKHDWIAATQARLGLAGHPPRRLYQDDLNPDSPTGAYGRKHGVVVEHGQHQHRRGEDGRASSRMASTPLRSASAGP